MALTEEQVQAFLAFDTHHQAYLESSKKNEYDKAAKQEILAEEALIKLAESFEAHEAKIVTNPGLEPTQAELNQAVAIILEKEEELGLDSNQISFVNNIKSEKTAREAEISLANPEKLSEEKINEISDLLNKGNRYNAAQLMQGKEVDNNKTELTPEESKRVDKVMREFQKAVDKVAPPMKLTGKKHNQHDNLRKIARNIGKNLRQNFSVNNIAKSMVRSMRQKLSKMGMGKAVYMVRSAKQKETEKGGRS